MSAISHRLIEDVGKIDDVRTDHKVRRADILRSEEGEKRRRSWLRSLFGISSILMLQQDFPQPKLERTKEKRTSSKPNATTPDEAA